MTNLTIKAKIVSKCCAGSFLLAVLPSLWPVPLLCPVWWPEADLSGLNSLRSLVSDWMD